MRRAVLVLAALLALLVTVERYLAASERSARSSAGRVGHLLSADERRDAGVAVVRVETPRGERFVYARGPDGWRGVDLPGVCDQAALDGLVRGLLDAQGLVVSSSTEDAAGYGVTSAEALRVFLCGPNALRDAAGDVRFAFDVGRGVPERGTAFVRRRGQRQIWAVDIDPRTPLETRVAPHLPPLLDPLVVPASWAGRAEGIARLVVERGGERLVLERRAREVTPEDLRAGEVPWTWVLDPGPDEVPAAAEAAQGFARFVEELRWSDALDARGSFTAATRLLLEGARGARLALEVSAPEAAGCRIRVGGALYVVPRDVARALSPTASAMTPGSPEPWRAPADR